MLGTIWRILLLALLTGTISAWADDTPIDITFIANTYTGPSKGIDPNKPAIIDKAVSLLEGQIRPTYTRVSTPRGWSLLASNPNICLANKIRTPEREKLGLFSKYPHGLYPPRRLQVHNDFAKMLGGYTQLEDILSETSIIIGIAGSSNYGRRVMPLVEKYPDRFFILASAERHEDVLLNMLNSRRIDAIFASSTKDWSEGAGDQQFTSIPFEEADPALLGYILCSKSKTGRQAIERLNKAMATSSFKEFFLTAHTAAFPESEQNFINKQVMVTFGAGGS